MDDLSKEEVLLKLKELTQDLYYLSESDYPLKIVHFDPIGASELTKEEVLTLTSNQPGEPIEVTDLAHFFKNVTKPSKGAVEDSTNKQIEDLQAFLMQQLRDTKVYRIGEREKQVYVLGTLNDGSVYGFRTIGIQA